jgi:hypothetical protein
MLWPGVIQWRLRLPVTPLSACRSAGEIRVISSVSRNLTGARSAGLQASSTPLETSQLLQHAMDVREASLVDTP